MKKTYYKKITQIFQVHSNNYFILLDFFSVPKIWRNFNFCTSKSKVNDLKSIKYNAIIAFEIFRYYKLFVSIHANVKLFSITRPCFIFIKEIFYMGSRNAWMNVITAELMRVEKLKGFLYRLNISCYAFTIIFCTLKTNFVIPYLLNEWCQDLRKWWDLVYCKIVQNLK